MNKTRVLHLVEYLYLGGIERLLQQLALHGEQGSDLHFFSYETSELSGIGKEIKNLGFPVTVVKKSAGRDWSLLFKLLAYIRKEQISVIHTHDFGPMEYAVLLKILRPSLTLIHTQHTLHHFVSNSKYVTAFQLAAPFYHALICVSEHVRNTLLDNFRFINKRKLITIPNGVNTMSYLCDREIAPNTNKLRLVSVSRISAEKNLNYLLRTCALLKESQIPFEFHHAGTSEDQEILNKTTSLIKELGIEQEVHMHGFCHDTRSILASGDIFVSASHTEGHPVAVLEAMSYERLCLVSDITPHREIDNDSLIFFDKNNEEALFNELKQIYLKGEETQAELKSKAKNSRVTVINKFSIDKMVERYEQQYI